jgi:hypothetical protein
MIEIELSKRERELIHLWIESMRDEAGHWGDGAAVFPDEEIVERKLDHEGVVRITRHHLELILEWSESSHHHTAFTVDEMELIDRIRKALSGPDAGTGAT